MLTEDQIININNIKLILSDNQDKLTNIIDPVTQDNIYNVINDLLNTL